MQEIQVEPQDFDQSKVIFGDLKIDKNKLPFIPVTYENSTLLLKTPVMLMPFGVKEWDEGDKALDLAFRGSGPAGDSLLQKMRDLDARVIEVAHKHSKAWFGKQKTKDVLDEFHNKTAKPGKKEEYGWGMKVKYPKNVPGVPQPRFYDSRQVEVDETHVAKNSKGRVLMELRPLYPVQGKFGLKWTLRQAMVTEKPQTLEGCAFGAPAPAADPAPQAFED